MNNVFGKRLASARKMIGMSLQNLADSLINTGFSITKQSLSKYEQGIMKPDSSMLIALANILNVTVDFFYYEPLDKIDLGDVKFRKYSSKINKTQTVAIEEKAKEAISRRLYVSNLLGILPESDKFNFREIKDKLDIEEAAIAFRNQWNLGNDPIPDVILMLEDHGFWVVDIEAVDGFDGFHSNILGQKIIVLKKLSYNEDQVRKRLTALHELAHAILHFSPEVTEKDEEKFCTAFASAVLYPKEKVIKDINPAYFHFYREELYQLKERWGISVKAIFYRVYDLGIIKESLFKKMMITYNSKFKDGEKKVFTSKERPTRFTKMIFQGIGMGLISLTDAANMLEINQDELRRQVESVA